MPKYLIFILVFIGIFILCKYNVTKVNKIQTNTYRSEKSSPQIELKKITYSQEFINVLNNEISQHKEISCSDVTFLKKSGVPLFRSFTIHDIESREQIEKLIKIIQLVMVNRSFELDEVHFLFVLAGKKITDNDLGMYSYVIKQNTSIGIPYTPETLK